MARSEEGYKTFSLYGQVRKYSTGPVTVIHSCLLVMARQARSALLVFPRETWLAILDYVSRGTRVACGFVDRSLLVLRRAYTEDRRGGRAARTHAAYEAVRDGNEDLLREMIVARDGAHMFGQGKVNKLSVAAAEQDNIHVVDCLFANGLIDLMVFYRAAATRGRTRLIDFVYNRLGYRQFGGLLDVAKDAAEAGHGETLEYILSHCARDIRQSWGESLHPTITIILRKATRRGLLAPIKPTVEFLLDTVARGGRQWLTYRNFIDTLLEDASVGGHLHIVQWIINQLGNRCLFDTGFFDGHEAFITIGDNAAKLNHLALLQWLIDEAPPPVYEAPWGDSCDDEAYVNYMQHLFIVAMETDFSVDVARWILTEKLNNMPLDDEDPWFAGQYELRRAATAGSEAAVAFLHDECRVAYDYTDVTSLALGGLFERAEAVCREFGTEDTLNGIRFPRAIEHGRFDLVESIVNAGHDFAWPPTINALIQHDAPPRLLDALVARVSPTFEGAVAALVERDVRLDWSWLRYAYTHDSAIAWALLKYAFFSMSLQRAAGWFAEWFSKSPVEHVRAAIDHGLYVAGMESRWLYGRMAHGDTTAKLRLLVHTLRLPCAIDDLWRMGIESGKLSILRLAADEGGHTLHDHRVLFGCDSINLRALRYIVCTQNYRPSGDVFRHAIFMNTYGASHTESYASRVHYIVRHILPHCGEEAPAAEDLIRLIQVVRM